MARTKRICSVPDCDKTHSSRGYCKTHAARFRKHGNAMVLLKIRGRKCSVAGCDRPHDSNGFCGAHSMRLKRHGDPLGGGTSHGEPLDFLINVAARYDGKECLIWPYGTGSEGRPIIHVGDTTRSASRYLCEFVYGPPPTPSHEAAHSCGKGHLRCIAPGHLRWATKVENEADKLIHGTHQFGENNPVAKLTEDEVEMIRSLRGQIRQREIAARFGISQSSVSLIQRGINWRQIAS